MKILYGICGIGNGHLYRQLPLIEHLLETDHQIMFFAYGNSLEYLQEKYKDNPHVSVVEVWVPYYVGNDKGLDFKSTQALNSPSHFDKNLTAFQKAQEWLGSPDLVITDYEPNAAQYGYAHNALVVTLDQQSKYLSESFPSQLGGTSYRDEVQRLRMFFPVAKRIACSFFNAPNNDGVTLIPSILREEIRNIKNTSELDYLVYISAQKGYPQSMSDMMIVLGQNKEHFHVFLPQYLINDSYDIPSNVTVYKHGNKEFEARLKTCKGIIATAGHGLLSEAMHLGIPVYAMPMKIYEQQLNAYTVDLNDFGLLHDFIEPSKLQDFILSQTIYRQNILQDKTVLLKGNAMQMLLGAINSALNNNLYI